MTRQNTLIYFGKKKAGYLMRFFVLMMLFISSFLFAQSEKNTEFRAVWVITWNHISRNNSVSQNKALVRTILDNVKKANMNAVLWQVRQNGTAYYVSSYEPWGSYAGSKYPGYDHFAYAVEEAHKRGIEIHAWFNVFKAASTAAGTPASENPEWICRNQSGTPMINAGDYSQQICLSPGLDTVRAYTIDVAMEIIRNYDIDGLHLDYVRWNEYPVATKMQKETASLSAEMREMDGVYIDYDEGELEKIQANRFLYDIEHPYNQGVPSSFANWEDWWRNSVTEFVKVLQDSIKSIRPWVKLSAAALGKYNWSGWQGYGSVYQDAALWFNEGYVDQLTPMHYHWTTADGFFGMLSGDCPYACWYSNIIEGINAGQLFSVGPGSYKFAENAVWDNHPSVVNKCRTIPWVDGFQFFAYGTWRDKNYWKEAADIFFTKKTKIRATKTILDTIPDSPTITLNQLDSLNYNVSVTPPVSIAENQWFAVYRSEDSDVDPDADKILYIHFGQDQFDYVDSVTGLQDYNGTYHYAATLLDRYWNESHNSNIFETDSILSFAPIVSTSYPAESDSISINDALVFTFSKTMDVSSFDGAISTIPYIKFKTPQWRFDHKKLTLTPETYLPKNTEFMFKIDSTVTDVNDIMLDGDDNGHAGDSYILNFKTKAADNVGPIVVYTHPEHEDSLDIEDAITVVFNELINPETITEQSVEIYTSAENLAIVTQIIEIDNKSVLNIRPAEQPRTDVTYSLLLRELIKDAVGNPMNSYVLVRFNYKKSWISMLDLMDDFTLETNWKQPNYSVSTTGIILAGTNWGYTTDISLVNTSPSKSAYLKYEWDLNSDSHLLRQVLPADASQNRVFDTTLVLQTYIYGDGTNTKFRFCIGEDDGSKSWPYYEVSKWLTIDWYGWRLVEWNLNDPDEVGKFEDFGDQDLNGSAFRFDSFQLTKDSTSAFTGKIYFDDLRLIKKSNVLVNISSLDFTGPLEYSLDQNYPNPFNPVTTIQYSIASPDHVKINVYNLLGQVVMELVDQYQPAGIYQVSFDASGLASGVYVYRMITSECVKARKSMVMQ